MRVLTLLLLLTSPLMGQPPQWVLDRFVFHNIQFPANLVIDPPSVVDASAAHVTETPMRISVTGRPAEDDE